MKDNKNKTLETYNKIAEKFSITRYKHFWVDEFDYYLKIIEGNKVLDIGCGAGRDASVFIKKRLDYTGIDASDGMIKFAKLRNKKGKFKLMDFNKLDFPDNSFDGFWASASFLHVPKNKIAKVLKEAKRVVKKNGVGFISIKEKVLVDEEVVRDKRYENMSRFFAYYKKREFREILENLGFKIIKIMTKDYKGKDETKIRWLCYFVRK